MALRALELYCGIGGFAAAVESMDVRVVGALDQSMEALEVYRLNFGENAVRQRDLERITVDELAEYDADIWWLSPPCQPYSVRGVRKDLNDPRAVSLVHLANLFPLVPDDRLPSHIAVENVTGFAESEARGLLIRLFSDRGYRVLERRLCPTELGVPSRRPRYYLLASRAGINPACRSEKPSGRPLSVYINPALSADIPQHLLLSAEVIDRFASGFRILDANDPGAYTTCFTSGYGKSLMHAGSYLRCGEYVRRFAAEEIACLLHFPPRFRFPDAMPARTKWRLIGNSLSVAAVREVLRVIPGAEVAH
ncbi:MAG TPA: DNA cytosine methyltransferase [Geobacteraceae bacterium]|nr:DNA cytosine methyltransferase [Geobacteraceae bacterium]